MLKNIHDRALLYYSANLNYDYIYHILLTHNISNIIFKMRKGQQYDLT